MEIVLRKEDETKFDETVHTYSAAILLLSGSKEKHDNRIALDSAGLIVSWFYTTCSTLVNKKCNLQSAFWNILYVANVHHN
jgi:hypothetical protein